MDQRQKDRVARNEVAYRQLNAALADSRASEPVLTCECGSEDCAEPLYASRDEYATVRENPRRFLVLPGHEIPAVERTVEEGTRFNVVEKREDTAGIVERY